MVIMFNGFAFPLRSTQAVSGKVGLQSNIFQLGGFRSFEHDLISSFNQSVVYLKSVSKERLQNDQHMSCLVVVVVVVFA